MDKLTQDLVNLLEEMLRSQRALLDVAVGRREAMRAYDIGRLQTLEAQEKAATDGADRLDKQRKLVLSEYRAQAAKENRPAPKGVTEIAARLGEPDRTRVLVLAAELKKVVEMLDRETRMNAKVSETVVRGMAKVLKIVTGLAQHAGLYMRNGRKAALSRIHMLEVTA